MQKVLTAEQMREVDRLTTERYGIPSIILMENAAHAVARVITEKLGGSVKGRRILILCGKGNNGGDGAALARILWTTGADVEVVIFGNPKRTKGDARVNFDIYSELSHQTGGELGFNFIKDFEDFSQLLTAQVSENYCCIVDAVFGTGLTKQVDESLFEIFKSFQNRLHVAVDIPSGLFADKPIANPFQHAADVTVTFTAPKLANILPPASNFNGELIIADIGSPIQLIEEQPSQLFLAEKNDAIKWLLKSAFSIDSYKNKRGHAVIVAGSEDYSGAAVLCGNAAMRSGVGLVTVVTPESSKLSVASRVLPELMVKGVAETEVGSISAQAFDELGQLLEKTDSIAIGSGLSQNESTKKFVEKVVENRRQPTIIDADALNLLSPFAARDNSQDVSNGTDADKSSLEFPLILTPHEGEFLRLLGTTDKNEINDRVAAVREFAIKHNVILILKGERVLIGEPGGRVVVNPTGNSGLGKAGNGDTLTGILAGFVAQAVQMNIDIFETVVAAVYIAGMAGDTAEKKYGKRVMTASDVRECMVDVFQSLVEENRVKELLKN